MKNKSVIQNVTGAIVAAGRAEDFHFQRPRKSRG